MSYRILSAFLGGVIAALVTKKAILPPSDNHSNTIDRIDGLERKIEELMLIVKGRSIDPSKADLFKGKSHKQDVAITFGWNYFTLLIITNVVMLVIGFIVIYLEDEGSGAKVADYIAYVFPILAAVLAGSGFFINAQVADGAGRVVFYFQLSLYFLFSGFLAYLHSKNIFIHVFANFAMHLAPIASIMLILFKKEKMPKPSGGFYYVVYFYYFMLFVAVFFSLYWLYILVFAGRPDWAEDIWLEIIRAYSKCLK